jgi:hypothetical protein
MFIKAKRFLRVFPAILVVASLFISSLPIFSVSAATDNIALSSNTGSPGDSVNITGSSATVTNNVASIYFNDFNTGYVVTIDNAGNFSGRFTVPNLKRGEYVVNIQIGSTNFSPKFTIKPKITLAFNSFPVYVGDQITIHGVGFMTGPVSICLDDLGTLLATQSQPKADLSGNLNVTITIPSATQGTHTIRAIDSTADINTDAHETFSISPRIYLSSPSGGVGDQITVNGNGFAGRSPITINLNGIPLDINPSDVQADNKGTFVASFPIKSAIPRGTYAIMAKDLQNNQSIAYLNIVQSIAISANSGSVGDKITIIGSSFAANDTITIYFDSVIKATSPIKPDGSFTTDIIIPPVTQGIYAIKAVDTNNNEAAKNFIVGPNITINPESDTVGTLVKVSGRGFTASSNITIYFDDESVGVGKTNATGSFTANFDVPNSSSDDHTVIVEDEDGNQATAIFTTVSKIALSVDSGGYGATITINGTGFAAGNAFDNIITFTIDNTIVLNIENIFTDLTGSFTATFTIGSWANGKHVITAVDAYDNTAKTDLTVEAIILLKNNTTGAIPGEREYATGVEDDVIQITGNGFKANTVISVKYGGTNIVTTPTSITTDATGSFTATFIVPGIVNETYIIAASDGSNTAATNFIETIEKDPPAAVSLISPLNSLKIKQPVVFNWTASSDKNGVTYELQIATDAGFTNIVIDINNIATNTYTMAKESKLESVNSENPYHWRVRAVDGVGNSSGWAVNTFIVGFIWPAAATYIILGVIGLAVLLVLGIKLGRKMVSSRDEQKYNYDMDTDIEDQYRDRYQNKDLPRD